MSLTERDRLEEQQRLEHTLRQIGSRMEGLQQELSGSREEVVQIRRHFWDDVRVNFDNAEEAVETISSLKQQAELLAGREHSYRHAMRKMAVLKKLQSSPYFGRIDFTEADLTPAVTERVYLGIASVVDDSEMDYLVYDWRAPISSLYYDYGPGAAEYDTPSGKIRGTLEKKRQYIIKEGRLQGLFDTGLTIGDELLKEVLGKQTDANMRSIVATIQKEQNKVIRSEGKKLLLVLGSAGSGKTSAALQRAAYLLYRYRDSLLSDQIVLFSPNPMFSSYVSTVLPELGEENMQQTTFHEYVERRLEPEVRPEHPYEQIEAILTSADKPGYEARLQGIRFKASLGFKSLLESYAAMLGKQGMKFKEIAFQDRVIISADQLENRFYALDQAMSMPNRLRRLSEELLQDLKRIGRDERQKPWVDDEMELLDNEDYVRVYRKLQKQKRFTDSTFDDFERERGELAAAVVELKFAPLKQAVRELQFIDLPAMYSRLFAERGLADALTGTEALPAAWPEICLQTQQSLQHQELPHEDAAPFLYFKELIEGFRNSLSVRHVFIDEGQDYTPFQFAFLKRLFPRAQFTVLGDINQAVFAHALADEGIAALQHLFAGETTEIARFCRSYRSTRPIVLFTRSLLAYDSAIVPFEREGSKPQLFGAKCDAELPGLVARRIERLKASGCRTVAVIGKTQEECRRIAAALQGLAPFRFIDREAGGFETGTVVIPSYLAKGVEFDAVIVYDASKGNYSGENERKLLYTVCTRAMHELHIGYTGERSPLLAEVPPELYDEIRDDG